jgi:hypothetical protein
MCYEVVNIGRGLSRIVVKSQAARKRFEDQPGIIVADERVIFPEELARGMLEALRKRRRPTGSRPVRRREEQMEFIL